MELGDTTNWLQKSDSEFDTDSDLGEKPDCGTGGKRWRQPTFGMQF
jgi:hypothetical protein